MPAEPCSPCCGCLPLKSGLKICSAFKIVVDVLGIFVSLYALFHCISWVVTRNDGRRTEAFMRGRVTEVKRYGNIGEPADYMLPVGIVGGFSVLLFVLSIADIVSSVLLRSTLTRNTQLQPSVRRLQSNFRVLVTFAVLLILFCVVLCVAGGGGYFSGAVAFVSAALSAYTAAILSAYIEEVKAAPPNLLPPPTQMPSSSANPVFGQPSPSQPYVVYYPMGFAGEAEAPPTTPQQ